MPKPVEEPENEKSERSDKEEKDSKKDLVKEHKRLVKVLKSPSHKDDKKEAKIQEKELKGYEKEESNGRNDSMDHNMFGYDTYKRRY